MGALRRALLPYAAELRHWFHLGLDDAVAMPADELHVLLETLMSSVPAIGWSFAMYANPDYMPEHGRRVVFIDDFTKGR